MKTLAMSQNYVTSIIHKFGDENNVINDAIAIHRILERQGTIILTECLAEFVGHWVLKHNLSNEEAKHALDAIVNDLREATYERLH